MRTLNELITREDVLAGVKTMTLEDKAGASLTIELKAMKRSELMRLMRQHPEDWDGRLLEHCIGDATHLELLDLGSFAEAQVVAGALCMGLPEAKKREEVRLAMAAMLASVPSSAPPANSAPGAGPAPTSNSSPSGS